MFVASPNIYVKTGRTFFLFIFSDPFWPLSLYFLYTTKEFRYLPLRTIASFFVEALVAILFLLLVISHCQRTIGSRCCLPPILAHLPSQWLGGCRCLQHTCLNWSRRRTCCTRWGCLLFMWIGRAWTRIKQPTFLFFEQNNAMADAVSEFIQHLSERKYLAQPATSCRQ